MDRFLKTIVLALLLSFLLMPVALANADSNGVIKGAVWAFIDVGTDLDDGSYSIGQYDAKFVSFGEEVKVDGDLSSVSVKFKSKGQILDVDFYVETTSGNYSVVKEVLHKVNGELVDRTIYEWK